MHILGLEEKRHNWLGDASEGRVFDHLVFGRWDVQSELGTAAFHIARYTLLVALGYGRGFEWSFEWTGIVYFSIAGVD